MWRILRYLIVLTVFIFAVVWLADHPGRVKIEWLGYQAEPPMGILIFLIAVLSGILAFIYRIWLGARNTGVKISRWRYEHKRQCGHELLTRGMVAVAAGERYEARNLERKTKKLLGKSPLTLLLSAQTAQLNGDEQAAEHFFRAMTDDPQTEFLGLRGLFNQAIKRGNKTEALRLVSRAHSLKPNAEWVTNNLFELQVASGLWSSAEITLKEAQRYKVITVEQSSRYKVILNYQQGLDKHTVGMLKEAVQFLRKASNAKPAFIPAIIALSRLMLQSGKEKKVVSLIKSTWKQTPHPMLVELYVEACSPPDTLGKVQILQTLYECNPNHLESALAITAAAIEARLWGEARRYLAPWLDDDPPARVCRLMAELEEGKYKDADKARKWLARAVRAEQDPAWVCDSCGHVQAEWTALCRKCDDFDRLHWRTPPSVAPISPHVRVMALPVPEDAI